MKFFDREGELVPVVAPFLDPSWTVLDVGAGNGKLSSDVGASTAATITLCDVYPHSVPGKTYLSMPSPTVLPSEDHAYDAVMMLFMLHHMETFEQQEQLLREALRVARKRLVILEDTAVGRFEWLANRVFDYVLNAPHGVPTPFTFRSTNAWHETLERIGFRVRHIQTFRGTWQPTLRTYTQTCLVAEPGPNRG
jgi:ubiquinone/menaquinone biosynthesis C-methylase UbiE